jgi:hypothetical protein
MYNTIDLDKVGKADLLTVLCKMIHFCSAAPIPEVIDTQKGYHVKMDCSIYCDLCRFVFDDQHRYELDFRKPKAETNILFEPFSARRLK